LPTSSSPVRTATSRRLLAAAAALRDAVARLDFAPPVAHVYNPLDYAWQPHWRYIERFGNSPKRAVFLGMNPGPFGMAQTGVPFGEIAAVRDWMGIHAPVARPPRAHPRRPIEGFSCTKSEVSGRRLWGLMAERFGSAEAFFASHFVANYCPLVFVEESSRNRTPDKLPAAEKVALFAACDAHLAAVIKILRPEWCIGIGEFAAQRLKRIAPASTRTGVILHPSPASPAANRGWAEAATRQLTALGVW